MNQQINWAVKCVPDSSNGQWRRPDRHMQVMHSPRSSSSAPSSSVRSSSSLQTRRSSHAHPSSYAWCLPFNECYVCPLQWTELQGIWTTGNLVPLFSGILLQDVVSIYALSFFFLQSLALPCRISLFRTASFSPSLSLSSLNSSSCSLGGQPGKATTHDRGDDDERE